MSPNPHDGPAGLAEPAIGIPIARNVSFDFCAPPLPIIFGPSPVFGASVPKTAINEYRRLRSRKGDVDRSATSCQDSAMKAEPKTTAMQFGTEGTFACIVSLNRSRHPLGGGERNRIAKLNISRHFFCDI
jgi:hypothetical protein